MDSELLKAILLVLGAISGINILAGWINRFYKWTRPVHSYILNIPPIKAILISLFLFFDPGIFNILQIEHVQITIIHAVFLLIHVAICITFYKPFCRLAIPSSIRKIREESPGNKAASMVIESCKIGYVGGAIIIVLSVNF